MIDNIIVKRSKLLAWPGGEHSAKILACIRALKPLTPEELAERERPALKVTQPTTQQRVISLEVRVAALEQRVAELEAKKDGAS